MAQSFCSTPKISEFVNSIHALKRMATPEEIAHSALYLASDASTSPLVLPCWSMVEHPFVKPDS